MGGGSKNKSANTSKTPGPAAAVATVGNSPTAQSPTTGLVPATPVGTPLIPVTPPVVTPTPTVTPTVTPTPGVRQENGLQIQDEVFTGKVTASGGLRIRSAPDSNQSNVVGSVPEGAIVNVEGKVLNGSEAEPGKGTVWYIVGPKQYVYCADGYIQRVGTPAPGPTPAMATPAR
jgi:hypothetical protein